MLSLVNPVVCGAMFSRIEANRSCAEQTLALGRKSRLHAAHHRWRTGSGTVRRLEQQKRLAQDANFVVTVSKWLRNEAGSKELVKLQKRVRPWWREDVLGTVGLTVRYGAKAIEFEKGKTAILVPSKDQLVATLDTVITAVRAGELDEHLAQQTKARGVPKSTRAA